jgi:DNA repair photolyase
MFPSTHDLEPKFLDSCIARIKDLIERGHKLIIVTKPRLESIRRLCAELEAQKKSFAFWFTIGSSNDDILGYWEPAAPKFKERFESLQFAFAAGFTTNISCEPCLDMPKVVELFHQVEPYVRDKIWIGTMNNLDGKNGVKEDNQGHPGFDAAIQRIEEGQTRKRLLEIHAALKDEPKVMWKGDFLALMRGEKGRGKGTGKRASAEIPTCQAASLAGGPAIAVPASTGIPLASVTGLTAEPICL